MAYILPEDVQKFIKKHGINAGDVTDKLVSTLNLEPRVKFQFDTVTYSSFGVLRVQMEYKKYDIQPILFGKPKALSKLSKQLWIDGAPVWDKKMQEIGCSGTFNKKVILNPAILGLAKKYYPKDNRILDVGCGEGSLCHLLSAEGGFDVYGFDVSKKMISDAKDLIPSSKSNFFVKDISKIKNPLKHGKFNLVVCSMVFSNLINDRVAFKNLIALIKVGGTIIFTDINPFYYRSIGYFHKENLVPLHDPNSVFYTEKHVGGHTKAVHIYRPLDYYRELALDFGLDILEEFVYSVDREFYLKELKDRVKDRTSRKEILKKSSKILGVPPFYFLVLRKLKI